MLGKKVKDLVTGFTGIATGKAEYLNGCVQYKISAKVDKTGDTKELWVDSQQLAVVGNGIAVKRSATGGPVKNTPKNNHP